MTQIYNIDHGDDVNRRNAEEEVERKFRKPLYGYAFPPRADVCFEGKCWLILYQSVDWLNVQLLWADLHTPERGNHQDQVKVLIEKTASSLDDTALKMLFVSVQQNNIELCIQYAIKEYVMFLYCWWDLILAFFSLIGEIGVFSTVCPHHNRNDCVRRLNVIQMVLTWATMFWFGHSYVSEHSIYWTGYSLFTK